jgi:hypothetical protein
MSARTLALLGVVLVVVVEGGIAAVSSAPIHLALGLILVAAAMLAVYYAGVSKRLP